MKVTPIPCLSDNYAYLVVCPATKEAAIVDVSEAEPVLRAVEEMAKKESFRVVAILSTHHHPDHVGGNEVVAAKLGIDRVYGYVSDRGRIPGQTVFLEDEQTFNVGKLNVRAIHIPGHTLGAVAYVITGGAESAVFTGDTMFVAGCGRLFEGDPPMMYASLEKLAKLPESTRVYCGHEYTESNLKFAAHVEPSNTAVGEARNKAAATRSEGRPTVPSTIGDELRINPFVRTSSAEIRKTLGIADGASGAEALGMIRKAKDGFR